MSVEAPFGHPWQFAPTHCSKPTYSVIAVVADAASHVGRHDGSFGRQLCTTQTAMVVQFGSFGQLVALEQQCTATQEAHDADAL